MATPPPAHSFYIGPAVINNNHDAEPPNHRGRTCEAGGCAGELAEYTRMLRKADARCYANRMPG